ncbi:phosphatase PAP2 family protein [Anaerolentibacter hominis]|uniref:phosphatase PAP2 family protein n=1 Tax=Anaerolentibacter hominis TaxID=3079009 RepID=UPI0031B811A9
MEMDLLYVIQNLHHPVLDVIMVNLSRLADSGILWICLALVFLYTKKYREYGAAMGTSLFFSFLAGNIILKNLVARSRPCWIDTGIQLLIANPGDYSFPSGHTSASFAAAMALFLYDKKLGIPALVLASLIGFSRMYLFVHFPTDVLAGAALGILSALAAVFLIKGIKRRRQLG